MFIINERFKDFEICMIVELREIREACFLNKRIFTSAILKYSKGS